MSNKVVKMKQVYWVIVTNPEFTKVDPDHFMMPCETTDLDEAIQCAKEQYSDAPQCKGNHAYVVLRDRWLEGDRTPLVDVQPD